MRRISDLPDDEARAALLACCGSNRWAERMLSQRPFRDRDDVFDSAERIWWDLTEADWLEAFAAHPRIGNRESAIGNPEPAPRPTPHAPVASEWSAKEQELVSQATDDVKEQLAELNAEYERRFGFIYIVCATGKSAEEMLALCRARLANESGAELQVAALEQSKITRLRVEKLLEIGS